MRAWCATDRSASGAGIAAYVTDSFSNVNLEVEVPRGERDVGD